MWVISHSSSRRFVHVYTKCLSLSRPRKQPYHAETMRHDQFQAGIKKRPWSSHDDIFPGNLGVPLLTIALWNVEMTKIPLFVQPTSLVELIIYRGCSTVHKVGLLFWPFDPWESPHNKTERHSSTHANTQPNWPGQTFIHTKISRVFLHNASPIVPQAEVLVPVYLRWAFNENIEWQFCHSALLSTVMYVIECTQRTQSKDSVVCRYLLLQTKNKAHRAEAMKVGQAPSTYPEKVADFHSSCVCACMHQVLCLWITQSPDSIRSNNRKPRAKILTCFSFGPRLADLVSPARFCLVVVQHRQIFSPHNSVKQPAFTYICGRQKKKVTKPVLGPLCQSAEPVFLLDQGQACEYISLQDKHSKSLVFCLTQQGWWKLKGMCGMNRKSTLFKSSAAWWRETRCLGEYLTCGSDTPRVLTLSSHVCAAQK